MNDLLWCPARLRPAFAEGVLVMRCKSRCAPRLLFLGDVAWISVCAWNEVPPCHLARVGAMFRLSAGWQGSWKELAAALGCDVRRVYHARYYLARNPRAGSRGAQPGKRRRVFA